MVRLFRCGSRSPTAPAFRREVGLDVGLKTFAALSNGEFVLNPRFFRKDEKALAKAQRKPTNYQPEKGQKATNAKRRKCVARIHERIAKSKA